MSVSNGDTNKKPDHFYEEDERDTYFSSGKIKIPETEKVSYYLKKYIYI